MTRRLLPTVALLLLAAPAVVAQPVPPIGPARRPPVSPYLGLAIGGNPGINYLSLVRPQQQFQQQVNQLQQQYQQSAYGYGQQDGYALGADPFLPVTGVVGRFNSLGSYFSRDPSFGGGGGISRGGYGGGGYSGGGFGGGSAYGGGSGGAGLSNQRSITAPTGGAGSGRSSSVPRR